MGNIPEEIKQKIKDESNLLFKENEYADYSGSHTNKKSTAKKRTWFSQGAHFGYSLAQKELEEKEAQVVKYGNQSLDFEMQALNNRREAEGLKIELDKKDNLIKEYRGQLEKWLEVDIRQPLSALKIAELHLTTQSLLNKQPK